MTDKIQQQVYTRGKRTLFQQSEGYGTVGMTVGLHQAFVKENIHPYCVYPTGCRENVLTVAHFPCGRMLLGQAVYVPKDFTGQRATFFAHNYILPPHIAGEVLRDFENICNVKFLTELNGQPLEELDALPRHCTLPRHYEERSTEALLHHIQSSIHSGKKTYIITHSPQLNLLSTLYLHLPDETKHQLGFTTYATEPTNKKGLHLIFIPEQAYHANRLKFAKEVVVDVSQNTGGKTPPLQSPFISPQRFFQEIEFLHIRLPHRCKALHSKSNEWLEANLDKLTVQQLTAIPDSFIQRHKSELFIILGILKKCASAVNKPFDLRYFLGSYNLPTQNYHRIIQNLRRLYQNYVTPENYQNINFLFRSPGDGQLDAEGLANYMEKFSGSANLAEKVMLY